MSRTLRPCKLRFGYQWLYMHFDHSGSVKVIQFCTDRKLIYDFLLEINCNLRSVCHHFPDTASRSPQPTNHHMSVVKRPMLKVEALCNFLVTTARRTTYYDSSRSLLWNSNVRLKTAQYASRRMLYSICTLTLMVDCTALWNCSCLSVVSIEHASIITVSHIRC